MLGTVDQQTVFLRLLGNFCSGDFQLAADHQTDSPDFFYQRRDFAQSFLEVCAHSYRVFQQFFFFNRFQHCQRCGADQRSAAKGGGVGARRKEAGVFFGYDDSADRNTAAQRFGQGHCVRRHSVVLKSEEFSGAAHSGLDFVEDEQNFMLVAELAQVFQEAGSGWVDSTLALDWFNDDGRSPGTQNFFNALQVVERRLPETGGQGRETLLYFVLAGHRQGGQGPAVKRAGKGNNLVTAGGVAGEPGQFDGGFVRFRAAVGKETLTGETGPDEFFGQLRLQGVKEVVGEVDGFFCLLRDRF